MTFEITVARDFSSPSYAIVTEVAICSSPVVYIRMQFLVCMSSSNSCWCHIPACNQELWEMLDRDSMIV